MNKELERAKNKLKKYLGEEDITQKKTKKVLKEGKEDYQIYHKSYSGAISEAKNFCEKHGFFWNDNEVFQKISSGPKKPSEGKTNKFYLQLYSKENEPAGKVIHIQVYGMSDRYELNMYFAPLKKTKYDMYEAKKEINPLVEDIKELAGVLSEASKLSDKKAEIRKAVLRAKTAGSSVKKTLKRLTSKFGVPVVLEDPDDDDLGGFFLVDMDKLKSGNEESFVSYVRNDMKDVDII